MRWDFFHKRESNGRSVDDLPCVAYTFDLPADLSLADALAAAWAAGLPKGSNRGGCVEVQTDLGIYSRADSKRLDRGDVIFKTWEELESAD